MPYKQSHSAHSSSHCKRFPSVACMYYRISATRHCRNEHKTTRNIDTATVQQKITSNTVLNLHRGLSCIRHSSPQASLTYAVLQRCKIQINAAIVDGVVRGNMPNNECKVNKKTYTEKNPTPKGNEFFTAELFYARLI